MYLLNCLVWLCPVLVVGEEGSRYGLGYLLVKLDQLGPIALLAAKKLTFGTGRTTGFL
jgi:hypothetical protein